MLAPLVEQLVEVARTEHLTRAAERLGVPQPTLSRSMARLADRLGTPLLVPDGRGVRLTRAGRVLAEHAERAGLELRAGLAAVRDEVSPETGRVVLGFLHSMGPVAVPRLVAGFRAERPGVRIGLVQDGTDRIVEGVLEGSVDVALVSPPPADSRLRTRELARQDLVLLVARADPDARSSPVPPASLASETLITLRPGFGVRTMTDELLHRCRVLPRYAFESDDLTTVAGLVAAGLGSAVLPQGTGDPASTLELALDDPSAVRTITAVWAGDRTPTEPAAALRRYVVDHGSAAFG